MKTTFDSLLVITVLPNGVYDEIHGSRENDAAVVRFPTECPACKAQLKEYEWAGEFSVVKYKCGGGFEHKTQIQRHTAKWWGNCPAAARFVAVVKENTNGK